MGTVAKTRRLYRSRTDRKLAGVCGGLAQHFNTDATLIRALFVVLALLGGPGLVLYLLAGESGWRTTTGRSMR